MNYRELINELTDGYGAGEARAIVRLVLEEQFAMPWTDVLCGAVDHMDEQQTSKLKSIIERLKQGEPVQYVIGKAEFYGREFHVEPGVLIPRPETEILIDECLHSPVEKKKVLDIGTGSGCIAVTMALECPEASVEAFDISTDALRIAAGNAQKLSADVTFRKVDILDTDKWPEAEYSMIISNPPYICNKERAQMERHVLEHEPELALFVPDETPLLFYEAIARFATRSLKKGGALLFEINRAYGKEVEEMMREKGFVNVETVKDQFGNDRIVKGLW